MKVKTLLLIALVVTLAGSMMQVGAVQADGLDGTPPNDFATNCQQYLGPLRSQIAQGDFAGVGPFGEHFTGQVNPGVHLGTVEEEAFLDALGIDTSCSQTVVPDSPDTVPDGPDVVPDSPDTVPDGPDVVPDSPDIVPDGAK